jgi:hypothetical protein
MADEKMLFLNIIEETPIGCVRLIFFRLIRKDYSSKTCFQKEIQSLIPFSRFQIQILLLLFLKSTRDQDFQIIYILSKSLLAFIKKSLRRLRKQDNFISLGTSPALTLFGPNSPIFK